MIDPHASGEVEDLPSFVFYSLQLQASAVFSNLCQNDGPDTISSNPLHFARLMAPAGREVDVAPLFQPFKLPGS